jgi:tetratricopeptide (TPR) repeat protein
LRAIIEYLGEHMPPGTIVWGLLPNELGDFEGYKALITPLLCLQEVEPWMDRHRFVVRDREPPTIIPELFQAKNDRVLVMELDFSNEATERSLNATALDRSLPHDTRMFAFFQLAAIDFAYKRLPEALEKYGHCFNYFNAKGNLPLASLCLKGGGDVMIQAGRPHDALKFFQQSIAISMDNKNLVTLQQGLHSAAQTSMDLGNAVDAEGYFKHASAVSGKLNNPYTKCDAMEKQGQAQWQLGKFKEAEETWTAAKNLSKMFAYTERAHSILDQMIAMYRLSNMPREAAQCEREKAELTVAERTGQGPTEAPIAAQAAPQATPNANANANGSGSSHGA